MMAAKTMIAAEASRDGGAQMTDMMAGTVATMTAMAVTIAAPVELAAIMAVTMTRQWQR